MKRTTRIIGGLCLLSLCLVAAEDPKKTPPNYNIPLWEAGKVPLAKGTGPLDAPFVTVFQPPASKRNGTAVVIAPGGSNIMLMYGGEGFEVAERYNDWGVTAFILTYRLSPNYNDNARFLDGKRAVQLVRSRAAEFKIDPKKIGFAGFSAGSALARGVVGTSGPGDTNAVDLIDRVSSRPDYVVMVYSAGRAAATEDMKTFPPTFLTAAAADRGAANGSAELFYALNNAGAIVELHLYQQGRHGFGAGTTSPEFSPWMGELQHFLTVGGFLPGGKK